MKGFRFLAYCALLLVVIGIGFALGHYKPAPILSLVVKFKSQFIEYQLAKQRSPAVGPWSRRTEIDSVNLPLHMDILDLSQHPELFPFTGGICAIGNRVFVLDNRGTVFYLDIDKAFEEGLDAFNLIEGEVLPTNVDEYFQARAPHYANADFERNFRAHDLACVQTGDDVMLVAIFDQYTSASSSVRQIVASIGLGPSLNATIGDWRIVFTSPTFSKIGVHDTAGAALAIGDDNDVYFSIGESGQLHTVDAVITDKIVETWGIGSVYRLDVTDGAVEKISVGHRNILGLLKLRSGALLATEAGPRGGDELNIVKRGSNYGWPMQSFGSRYGHYYWDANTQASSQTRYEQPVFSWLPSITPTKLIEMDGFHPRWDGDLLIGSLRARSIFRVRFTDERVLFAERIWVGQRVRDMIQLDNGSILMWTDSAKLIRLQPDRDGIRSDRRPYNAHQTRLLADCLKCHKLEPTNATHDAPSLLEVVGRPIASDNFDHYSEALKSIGGNWNEANLSEFLSSPETFAPGTSMVLGKQYNKQEIATIIAVLKEQY